MRARLAEARRARLAGTPQRAVPLLQQELARAPNDPQVLEEIGLTAQALDDIGTALGALVQALGRDITLVEAGRRLSDLLASHQLTDDAPLVVGVIEGLFARHDVAAQPLVRSALNIALRRPAAREALALIDAPAERNSWDQLPAAFVRDRLLLTALERGYNRDPALEKLLTRLRRDFLLHEVALAPEILAFATALAQQAHNNEFVFLASEDEHAAAARLAPENARDLLRLAMYRPVWELTQSAAWPAPVDRFVAQHLAEHDEEARLRAEIPQLAPIAGETSTLVKQHYEDNPYPRWFSLTVPPAEGRLRLVEGLLAGGPLAKRPGRPLQVLIAGGGTGFQSVGTALAYGPKAALTAIDLSRASLAHSVRKAREYKADNLQHICGDLLEVGRLPHDFDVIESTGVLVCVADPTAALQRLVGKLRPGGLVYLALYSELARWDVVAARALIAAQGFGDSPDEMRRFRRMLMDAAPSPLREELLRSPGFYSLSTCRDFLFHKVEHRFTLPQVRRLLADCGLTFRGWDLAPGALAGFRRRFGNAADATDFALWDAYEKEHPLTFRGMYKFWSQKPAK